MTVEEMLQTLHPDVAMCPAYNPNNDHQCVLEIGHTENPVTFQDKVHAFIDDMGDLHHWY